MQSVEMAKQKAVEIMLALQIDEQYIRRFAQEGQVFLFDVIDEKVVPIELRPEIAQRKIDIEEDGSCIVYAVTHEKWSFGELYDFLFVSSYLEDMNCMYDCYNRFHGLHNVYAKVWNVASEWLSDTGRILVKSRNGKIYRLL